MMITNFNSHCHKYNANPFRGNVITFKPQNANQDSFVSSNPKFNRESIEEKLQTRAFSLPMLMDMCFINIMTYLNGNNNIETFNEESIKHIPRILQRANFGDEAQEYSINYEPELKTLCKVATICEGYDSGIISKDEHDRLIEDVSIEYCDMPIKRTKYFMQ